MHLGECFGTLWFYFAEAWENLFKLYDEKEGRVTKDQAQGIIDRLVREQWLERVKGDQFWEYRLTEKARVALGLATRAAA